MLKSFVGVLCILLFNITENDYKVESFLFRQRQPQTVLVGGGPNGQSMLLGNGQSFLMNGNGGSGGGQMLMNGQNLLMNGNGLNGGNNMVFRTARLSPLQQLFSNTAEQDVLILQNGIQGFANGNFGNGTNHTKYYKNEKHYHNHYHTHKKPKHHHHHHHTKHHEYHMKHHYEEPEHHYEPHHHYDHHEDKYDDKYDDKHEHYDSHHHYDDHDDDHMEYDAPEETKIRAKVVKTQKSISGSSSNPYRRKHRSKTKLISLPTPPPDDTYLEDEPSNEIVQQDTFIPTKISKFETQDDEEDIAEKDDGEEDESTLRQLMDVIPFKNIFT